MSIVLSTEEAGQLVQAAQEEEERCWSLKTRSEKHLEDATAQLAEAEKQLFDAQMNLGHVRYILRKSNFQLPEPRTEDRVQRVVRVNGGEHIFLDI